MPAREASPAHSHAAACSNAPGNSNDPTAAFPAEARDASPSDYGASANGDMNASFIKNSTGGGRQHANVQPFLCVNYIIALVGVFPSRN